MDSGGKAALLKLVCNPLCKHALIPRHIIRTCNTVFQGAGDMRRVLNLLQATYMAHGFVGEVRGAF